MNIMQHQWGQPNKCFHALNNVSPEQSIHFAKFNFKRRLDATSALVGKTLPHWGQNLPWNWMESSITKLASTWLLPCIMLKKGQLHALHHFLVTHHKQILKAFEYGGQNLSKGQQWKSVFCWDWSVTILWMTQGRSSSCGLFPCLWVKYQSLQSCNFLQSIFGNDVIKGGSHCCIWGCKNAEFVYGLKLEPNFNYVMRFCPSKLWHDWNY